MAQVFVRIEPNMALTKSMNLRQIKSFLENELKEQIFLEIAPILHIGQETGGYFGVTRQVLCLVNFLGALYCGYAPAERRLKQDIGPSSKALRFIKDVLGDIDPAYRSKEGKYLYEMYRHGLVHLYQPKTLKLRDGRLLKWMIYKGGREPHTEIFNIENKKYTVQGVKHLGIMHNPFKNGGDYLAISITCLYKDLLTSIDSFYERIKKDRELLKKWRQTANAISKPVDYPKKRKKHKQKVSRK